MRCQRVDGSYYGTAGICRQGREVDALVESIKNKLTGSKKIGEGAEATVLDVGGGVVVKQGRIPKSEAKILESLKNVEGVPRFVMYEAGHQGDRDLRSILAMNKVSGDPIFKLNKEEKSDAWDDAFRVLKQIHGKGIAHNDLHGNNVLYDRENQKASIIDFGKSQANQMAVINELNQLYGRTKDTFYNASGPVAQKFASNYEKMWNDRFYLNEKKDFGRRKQLMQEWIGRVYQGIQ